MVTQECTLMKHDLYEMSPTFCPNMLLNRIWILDTRTVYVCQYAVISQIKKHGKVLYAQEVLLIFIQRVTEMDIFDVQYIQDLTFNFVNNYFLVPCLQISYGFWIRIQSKNFLVGSPGPPALVKSPTTFCFGRTISFWKLNTKARCQKKNPN